MIFDTEAFLLRAASRDELWLDADVDRSRDATNGYRLRCPMPPFSYYMRVRILVTATPPLLSADWSRSEGQQCPMTLTDAGRARLASYPSEPTPTSVADLKPYATVRSLDGRWLIVDEIHDHEPAPLVQLCYRDADGRYAGEEDWPKSEPVEVAPPGTVPWRTPEEER